MSSEGCAQCGQPTEGGSWCKACGAVVLMHPTREIDAARRFSQIIERIRELHQPRERPAADMDHFCSECFADYPCPTLQLCDGKTIEEIDTEQNG